MVITKSIFFKPRDKKLAKKISIKTPYQFNKSIENLKKYGVTMKEKKALTLAKARAEVQLKRKNLSVRERNQFKTISKMNLPKVSKR